MIAPWLVTPLAAVVIIAGCAVIARMERAGRSNASVTAVALGMFLVLVGVLVSTQDELVAWMTGVLVGIGIGYAFFFHRNARRPAD